MTEVGDLRDFCSDVGVSVLPGVLGVFGVLKGGFRRLLDVL